MSIEGIIIGAMMLIANPADGIKKVYNGIQLINKVHEKTEAGTWGKSAHEESHQIIKDTIRRLGQ
tara:strand:- start:250 stop:444 length:195 start_codon:yes stop_codon:yes gene_type:complete